MNTELSLTIPTADEYTMIRRQSEALVKTGFLPAAIKTPEQALAIILTGRELGIPAMAALNTINVIQGKPTVSPQLMLALIERSGQLEDIQVLAGEDFVQVTMQRRNRTEHTERFGRAEAQAMNLISKDNYKKQPLVMYKWRAIAACARVVFPDVILGLYTPDEMGADVTVTDDGAMFVAEAEPTEPTDALVREARDWFKKLNEVGHEPKWTPKTATAFVNQMFGVSGGIDDLLADDLQALCNELSERHYKLITDENDRFHDEFQPDYEDVVE